MSVHRCRKARPAKLKIALNFRLSLGGCDFVRNIDELSEHHHPAFRVLWVQKPWIHNRILTLNSKKVGKDETIISAASHHKSISLYYTPRLVQADAYNVANVAILHTAS